MEPNFKIPITPVLLTDMGFEEVKQTKETFYRLGDVEMNISGDGKTARWKGHQPDFNCWEEFLAYHLKAKGEDFEPHDDLHKSIEEELF